MIKKFNVKGMHCGSCAMLVTDALEELDGINNVRVEWEADIVEVNFDDSKLDNKSIIQAMKECEV